MNAWMRIKLACLAVLVIGLAPTGAALAQVKVIATSPSSASQGTASLDVVVTGSGFNPSAKAAYVVSGTSDPGGIVVKSTVYRSSTELVTTIAVADNAALASFDVVVTLDTGRKGKGTTLFIVKAKTNVSPPPPPPPPPPTYPPARYWHALASNGGETPASSRLYMFGGDGVEAESIVTYNDLWVYANAGSTGATWTLVSMGSVGPGPRKHVGWSCGGGHCVASNGSFLSPLKETWVFAEATQVWTQVGCSNRRVLCPSARRFATMAYDTARGTHVLFGGSANGVAFNDTYTFSPGTMTWVGNGTSSTVSARSRVAATFVPPLGRIVMFGGQQENVRALSDMFTWSGTAWTAVPQLLDTTVSAVPSLHSHSMVWDPTGSRLVVAGGLVDASDTPNPHTYYVTFANVSGAWNATWTLASGIGCQSAAGSPPDSVVHPQARMAFDIPSGTQVFFGGGENQSGGVTAFGNTVECR